MTDEKLKKNDPPVMEPEKEAKKLAEMFLSYFEMANEGVIRNTPIKWAEKDMLDLINMGAGPEKIAEMIDHALRGNDFQGAPIKSCQDFKYRYNEIVVSCNHHYKMQFRNISPSWKDEKEQKEKDEIARRAQYEIDKTKAYLKSF